MQIRLIASDMDDTLLNSERQITPRTLAALNEAKRRGIYVVLASGRMVESMLDAARQVDVNAPLIAYNGGAIYDTEARRYLHEDPIPVEHARALCRLAEQMELHAQGYDHSGYFFPEDNAYSDAYGHSIHLFGRAVHKPLSDFIDQGQFKILLIDSAERIGQALPVFQREFSGRVNCMTSKPIYLECTAPAADKGAALGALCEDLGVSPREVLAFGDGLNDLSMLRFAGHGYAMANAGEAVKSQAPNIAPSNDEDGVAQVIERMLAL